MKKLTVLSWVLALAGCATYSPRSYDQTISLVRSAYEASSDGYDHYMGKGVFEIHEEGSVDGDHWAISFFEGSPSHKHDVILPKRTTISVGRGSRGRATYDVRCENRGLLQVTTRDRQRETFWREQLRKSLGP
jgi:hypothetical protein